MAKSAKGCLDTVNTTLRVYSKPTITIADTQFCANTSVNFGVQLLETVGLQYNWRFGDGNGSVLPAPLHTYNTGGVFYPQLKITHGGTDSCFARFDSVTVYGLPVISFSLANDTLCFDGNNACIIDSTAKGPFGAGIKSRTLVFGDGFIDNTTPLSINTICHQYTDPSGGSYPITIEATDSNQCFSRRQVANAVIILPAIVPGFTVAENKTCFSNLVTITNTSPFDSATLDNFVWTYGDGATDSANWLIRQHLYTTSGNYTIQLTVTDTSGCTKTANAPTVLQSVVLDINPSVNRDTSCFFNNSFLVSNPINAGATALWQFGDGSTDTNWTTLYGYNNPGNFGITLRVQAQSCDTLIPVKTVTVLGPRANTGNPLNRYQCLIHDTVYFTGALLPYLSNHGPAPGNVQRIWSFGDAFAPQCTTDTKNGINVGLNCNFSRDSMDVKHWYTPGKEGCYTARLQLRDTLWNCLDTSTVSLGLMPPKASADTGATPPVPGLSFPKPDCLGPEGAKSKIAFLSNTQPSCTREMFWVMWDSLCAEQSGSFNAGWRLNDSIHNYQYTSPPCDTAGRVTVGLIIRNGQDTAGNFCFDTAWYHHVFQFNDLSPFFSDDFNPAINRCPGTTIKARISDTAQSGILSYQWSFDDGSPMVTTTTPSEISHTFADPGTYTITLSITNADGCVGTHQKSYHFGFDGDFTISQNTACVGDTLEFTDDIFYFDIGGFRWKDTARQSAGKERLSWDFGDGRGFATTGNNPKVVFDKVGTYTVRLALKDSSGCVDTIVKPSLFTVYGTYARFFMADTIVCPQLVQLKDSSRVYDPANFLAIPPGDSIAKWEWSFGVGKPKSFIKNPFHDFGAGGDYHLSLKVENTRGCKDSTETDVFVKGPIPSFIITSDTIGCSPLTVTFKNQSANANKYTWNFRDAASNTLTTLSDSDVYNVYTGGGLYKPYLQAESNEFDATAGHNVTCRAVFPDTALQSVRLIAVNATPVANFGTVNNCTSFSLNFIDSSLIDSGSIASHLWLFGDGDSSALASPTHIYADTGTYTVKLLVWGSSGCMDSVEKTVAVAPPPTARFVYNDTCHNHTTQFADSSITNNAFVVRWDWTFGDGTTSLFQNPTRQYLLPGTYNVKLKILTNAGCVDSVTHDITINPLPAVDFTAADECRLEAVNFTNNTTISAGTLTYSWNFGDAGTSAAVSPAHVYTADGAFTVKLIATANGCSDSVSKGITIHPLPVTDFDMNIQNQCVNTNAYHFINKATISSGVLGSDWNFGDGNTSTVTEPDYQYGASAVYPVTLISTSGFGCKDTMQKVVRVYPKPTAGFTINDTAQCLNINSFILTNTSTDTGSLTYSWNFGNSTSSALGNPTVTYSAEGLYIIRLVASTAFPCRDTVTDTVRVLPVPAASFTINDTGQCVNNNLFVYTNTSAITSGLLTAQWQFGDGQGTTANSPSHTYALDSGYAVTLISVSGRGCRDTAQQTVTVFPKPFPAFAVNDSDQCINTNLYTFSNQTVIKYGNNTYNWHFGDGTSSTSASPNHVYVADSNFIIRMVATSNQNCIDSVEKQVTVFPKPLAKFIINDTGQCLNTNNYQFTDQTFMKSGGLRYDWSFGDGGTSVVKNPGYVYVVDSQYTVKLIARSDFDCFDTVSTTVDVFPVPSVKFLVNDSDQCVNENLYVLTNQSTIKSGSLSYQWWFGTEGTGTSQHEQFTFTADTSHIIKLKAISDKLCTDSTTRSIMVLPKPNVQFSINDTGQCVNANRFDFTNQSNIKYGTLAYSWDFANGETSNATDTSMVYTVYGKYKPRLVATSDLNCKDTLIKDISVYPKPNVQFTVNDSDQCRKGNLFQMANTSNIPEGFLLYKWYWGNGDSATGAQPAYAYPLDSSYIIKLLATSGWGCKDSLSMPVVVYPQPLADFDINDTAQCVNANHFIFTNKSAVKYGTLQYTWNFANGEFCNCIDTSIVYNYDTVYRVVMQATTNNGCRETAMRSIKVHSKPSPGFSVNDTDQCVNANFFQFFNTSTIKEGANSYTWTFGDGNSDTSTFTSKVYTVDTAYTVKLLAVSENNCRDSIEHTLLVYPKPGASFTVNDSTQCVNGNSFTFTNKSVIKYGTLNYGWNFGDSISSSQAAPTHIYTTHGPRTVTLYAQSNVNCFDTAVHNMEVYPKPNPAFNVNDSDQCLDSNQFAFTDTSNIASGTYTSKWIYSDGRIYSTTSVNRKFNNPGTYQARLVLTSNFQCADSVEKQVVVYPHPSPDFFGLKKYYCTDYALAPILPLVPGGTFYGKNMQNDTFVPTILGPDTVRYEVSVNGCKSDTVKYTRVLPLPTLNIGTDTMLCRREFLVLDVSFPNSTYLWQDGIVSPRYKIIQPGKYKVTLFNLCDTLTQEINVTYRDYDCNFFFPTAFTPGGDDKNEIFYPYIENAEDMRIQIYDRWGALIFESKSKDEGWDGTYQGEPAPIGVYLWKINMLINENGFYYEHTASGNVTLLR